MNVYVPSSKAEALSEALWSLARPPQVRSPGDTTHLFRWVTATDGSPWLVVRTTLRLQVHEQAEMGEIEGILAPWVQAGHLPADTIPRLQAIVETCKTTGELLRVYEAFPPLFQLPTAEHPEGLARTLGQMIDAGLLAQPSLP